MELTALEQHLMLAVMRLHPNAYGVSIGDHLEDRIGRSPSTGTIYACLERLEEKGFVETRKGETTPERGGRRKVYFTLTALGQKALRSSLNDIKALSRGVKWAESFAHA